MKHIIARAKGNCSEIISSELGMDPQRARELVQFGAVYVRHAAATVAERCIGDDMVYNGDYIRVHPNPRRYPHSQVVNWKNTIKHESRDFVIINKPSEVPSNPTVDNFYENVIQKIRMCSDMRYDNLYLPHRLDTDTSGLLVVAKTKEFTSYMGALLKSRSDVNKRYRALLAFKPCSMQSSVAAKKLYPGRELTHYLEASSRSPKRFYNHAKDAGDGALQCTARIISLSPIVCRSMANWTHWLDSLNYCAGNATADEYRANFSIYRQNNGVYSEEIIDKFRRAMISWLDNVREVRMNSQNSNRLETTFASGTRADNATVDSPMHMNSQTIDDSSMIAFCEVELELITGRTHQCRGQLQALGDSFHIAGDNMYVGATSSRKPNAYCSSPYLALQACSLAFRLPPANLYDSKRRTSTSKRQRRESRIALSMRSKEGEISKDYAPVEKEKEDEGEGDGQAGEARSSPCSSPHGDSFDSQGSLPQQSVGIIDKVSSWRQISPLPSGSVEPSDAVVEVSEPNAQYLKVELKRCWWQPLSDLLHNRRTDC